MGRVAARVSRAALALATLALAVLPPAAASALPDGRGWEMVSPVDKNGGSVAPPEGIGGGGVLQAAADGQSVTYGSTASFGTDATGAPPGSQYLSRREAGGWSTANLSVPLFSGSYGPRPDGVPYQLFSTDLGRGLLLNGSHCRSSVGGCPVENPPLVGTDAPAGYLDYYLWRSGAGFEALLGSGDLAGTDIGAAAFDLRFAGATADLSHVGLESCAALTPGASEVALGEGCDDAQPNLYEWSAGAGLTLVNTVPGARLAAQSRAISADGSRVYFVDLADGGLRLREGGAIKRVDEDAGEDGTFQTASLDGRVAFFTTAAGHLWRYDALADAATDLTPAGGVLGVLGASDDGSYLYYVATDGLYLWHAGATTKVPTTAVPVDAAESPPTSGSARVSADGTQLLLVSRVSLNGYNNVDSKTGLPDSEVWFYDATKGALRCVSCRPNGNAPAGSSAIPGALANGSDPGAADLYKPRVLVAGGTRIFFESSDVLSPLDVNREPDVYQWEALGPNCGKVNGCIELISSGTAEEGARFVDASTSGDDVFFTTDESLVPADPGSIDLYDARVGGGFPAPPTPIPCFGDSCQALPGETKDPALGTLITGPGNPKVHYFKYRRRTSKGCKAGKKGAKGCHKKAGKKKGGKKGKDAKRRARR